MGHGLTILSADVAGDRIYLLLRSTTLDGSATVLKLDASNGLLVGERKLILGSGRDGAKSAHHIQATDSAVLLASFDGAVFEFRRQP